MDVTTSHLAITVRDLAEAKRFYGETLGCDIAAEDLSAGWFDVNFFGIQLSCHYGLPVGDATVFSKVDGIAVPLWHFGPVLGWENFDRLAERLRRAEFEWVIEPTVRYAGHPREQKTMFFRDPSGNAIEVKAFRNPDRIFSPQ